MIDIIKCYQTYINIYIKISNTQTSVSVEGLYHTCEYASMGKTGGVVL